VLDVFVIDVVSHKRLGEREKCTFTRASAAPFDRLSQDLLSSPVEDAV